jgi:Chlorite dismutase
MQRPTTEKPDIDEKGARDQRSQSRLFMQLTCFGGCRDTEAAVDAVKASGLQAVVYEDIHNPFGIGVLTMSEEPADFAGPIRRMYQQRPFADLRPLHDLMMFGRTYSLGYEHDLDDTLFQRPRRTALNPDWPWAIWYPLRRSGKFSQLPRDEQMEILKEHGTIGMAFGQADFAHDIRLASHGLDRNDNDFTVALMGKDLHPLSAIVQTMRKTRQTSQYIERLGPFFVAQAVWQSKL